jgi:predicted TIM-barrel fold metal-dependent hydrolase
MNTLSIVDSHVHLWNPAQLRYSWLDGLPALNRAFLPADFVAASGGDWPVATLATSYERWLEAVREFFPFATGTDRLKLFQTNAERIYRV